MLGTVTYTTMAPVSDSDPVAVAPAVVDMAAAATDGLPAAHGTCQAMSNLVQPLFD